MLVKKLKQAWSNWLNRMASQNKAAFGSETLDCCRVGRENRQKNKKKRKKTGAFCSGLCCLMGG